MPSNFDLVNSIFAFSEQVAPQHQVQIGAGGVTPVGLPSSPTVNAMAEAAFDDRLDPNAVAISPLNPKWLESKVS